MFQKPGGEEPSEEDEMIKHIDPLHQLIQLFSRTALTEKWWVSFLILIYNPNTMICSWMPHPSVAVVVN